MIDKSMQNDQLMESLSSLFDDLGTKDDIDRILACETTEWQHKMQAYALTHAILNAEDVADFSALNLVSRVREAINQEDSQLQSNGKYSSEKVVDFSSATLLTTEGPLEKEKPKDKSQDLLPHFAFWKKSLGSLALAASVAFIVISGGSYLLDGNGSSEIAPMTASVNPIAVDIKPIQQVNVELNNKRLQNYLRQHAEQSTMATGQSMLPMARVVGYPVEQK